MRTRGIEKWGKNTPFPHKITVKDRKVRPNCTSGYRNPLGIDFHDSDMRRKLLSVVDLVIIDTNPTTFSHKVCELSLGSAHNFPSCYRNLPGIDFGDSDMRRKLFSVVDLLYIHSNLPDSRAPDPSSIWAPPSSAPNIDFRESDVRTKL